MPRVLIADDHCALRHSMIEVLAEAFPNLEIGESGTARETIDRLAESPWDVLLLDIFMPGRNGLEVLETVKQRWSALPVLVLSSVPEEQLATRVLRLGATGYLNKQAAAEELVPAVRTLLAGGTYVSGKSGR